MRETASPRIRCTPAGSALRLATALAVTLLASCGSYSNVAYDVRPPGPDDPSIIVLGSELRTTLHFGQGTVDEHGSWTPSMPGTDGIHGGGSEIYLVRSLAPTDATHRYGLYGVERGARYQVACGSPMLVFAVPRGKVLYLTDVTFTVRKEPAPGAWTSTHADFNKARDYVEARYPQLKGRLEPGLVEMRSAGSVPGLATCSH